MKTVNVLYIERADCGDESLADYKRFISSVFHLLGYATEIEIYSDKPDRNKIDAIISNKSIDVIFCDLTLGNKLDENALGLENIKYLKQTYPEIVVCGISGKTVTYRMTASQKNLPTFDLFVEKMRHDDDDYIEYIKNEMGKVFCSNVGIEIVTDNLLEKDKKFASTPVFQRLLKKISFTTHGDNHDTSVKKIILYPTTGGYSSSYVFKMICQTVNGETVISSVLKCSEKSYASKEIDNYMNFVKWYLPYTWRPEMLAYAFSKDYGMICYSFVYNDAVPFSSLTDKIKAYDYQKINNAIEKIFGGSHKQWYGENNRKLVFQSINSYYRSLYFPQDRKKPFDVVDELIAKLNGQITDDQYHICGKTISMAQKLFIDTVTNSYQECICHGDLNTDNIQISEGDELIFIDFQDTGKGHVFHDFVVFEMCLRLYRKPPEPIDFNALLENEIKITNDDFSFATEKSIWKNIQKIRSLARENFPDEEFKTYYLSIAMRALRLFRNFYSLDSKPYECKMLLTVLLANLLKLDKEKLSALEAKKKSAASAGIETNKNNKPLSTKGLVIGIVCAKDNELTAILESIENKFEIKHQHFLDKEENNRSVYTFQILKSGFEMQIFITKQLRQGNTSAATAYNSLAHFKPDYLLFVGIAGSLNSKIRIGDVLIPQTVFDATLKKEKNDNNFQIRGTIYQIRSELIGFISYFIRSCAFNDFTVSSENILSDNTVLASDNSEMLKKVFGFNDQIFGVEMESAGIYSADYESRKTKNGVFTIRGISDNSSSIKDDSHHSLAVKNASLVMSELLEKLFERHASEH